MEVTLVSGESGKDLAAPTLLLIIAGMRLCVLFLEFGESGVGVDGGGGDALMTEELLNGFELSAVGKHCGGERVAQDVGGAALLRGDAAQGILHDGAELVIGKAMLALREEEGAGGSGV